MGWLAFTRSTRPYTVYIYTNKPRGPGAYINSKEGPRELGEKKKRRRQVGICRGHSIGRPVIRERTSSSLLPAVERLSLLEEGVVLLGLQVVLPPPKEEEIAVRGRKGPWPKKTGLHAAEKEKVYKCRVLTREASYSGDGTRRRLRDVRQQMARSRRHGLSPDTGGLAASRRRLRLWSGPRH
ncbi:hypothetical protein MRX96_044237 [Rhipicephalus microplus]